MWNKSDRRRRTEVEGAAHCTFPNKTVVSVVCFLKNICQPTFTVYTPENAKGFSFCFLRLTVMNIRTADFEGAFRRFIPSLFFNSLGFEVRSLVIPLSTFLLDLKCQIEADGKLAN